MLACRLLLTLVSAWHCASAASLSDQGQHELETEPNVPASMSASVGVSRLVGDGRKLIRTEPAQESASALQQGSATSVAGVSPAQAPRQEIPKLAELAVTSDATMESVESGKTEQNCEWYDWSSWSYCSKTCGHGYKTRQRSHAVLQRHDGTHCTGDSEQVDYCNTQECPLDCEWGDWDAWSKCTNSCDGGTRLRSKPIAVHNNSIGKPCHLEEGMQTEDCGTAPCPHDCEWAVWSSWSLCSVTCAGGNRTRHRFVARASSGGGLECDGNASEVEACNSKGCPEDCVLGDWGAWDVCSASCGNGTKARERTVLTLEMNGGAACNSSLREEAHCSLGPCRTDCVWGNWSDWTPCAVSCGGNQQQVRTSYRSVAVAAVAGGTECEGQSSRSEQCGQEPCPVDCKWGHWTTWRVCSKTCGGGITDRYRIRAAAAQYGGANCTGSGRDVKHCALNACPVDCRLSDWSDWGDCSAECGGGEAMRFRSELVPASLGGKECEGDTSEARPCVGTDCVSGAWLLKHGAVAVSGSMVGFTRDPISYASSRLNEDVTKRFLSELPGENITRVHVSMMPSKDLGNSSSPTDVHIWFSLVIPNTTNSDKVLANLNECERHPRSCSMLYRDALTKAGCKSEVNITEFEVGKIKRLKRSKFFVTYKNKTERTDNASNASDTFFPRASYELEDWNNPLRSRVECACRLSLPSTQKSETFGEDDETLKALRKTFAELANMDEWQVRSSQVSHQSMDIVNKFVARKKLPPEQEKAWNASQEGSHVDSWISILGDKAETEVAAVKRANDMSDGIMREDNLGVSERMNDYLSAKEASKQALIQAKEWTPSTVTFMLCAAVGELPDEQKEAESTPEPIVERQTEDPKPDIRVTGVLELQVFRPRVFSSDARTEMACKSMISDILQLPSKRLRVSIVPKQAIAEGEYYEAQLLQRAQRASLLQIGDASQPQIEELSEDELNSMDDSEPMRGKGKALEDETAAFCWFLVHYASNETAVADQAVGTMQNLDWAMTGLKLQNHLMDMRMTMTVTVTNITAQREVPLPRQPNTVVVDVHTQASLVAMAGVDQLSVKSAAGTVRLDFVGIFLAVALYGVLH